MQFRKSHFLKYYLHYWQFLKTKQKCSLGSWPISPSVLSKALHFSLILRKSHQRLQFQVFWNRETWTSFPLFYLIFPLPLLRNSNEVTTLEAMCCFHRKKKISLGRRERDEEYSLSSAHSWIRWCKIAFSPRMQLHTSIQSSSLILHLSY